MTSEGKRPEISRADQIRQKRQQDSQQRVSTPRQQPSAARSSTSAFTTPNTTYRRTSPYATPNLAGARPVSSARKVHYARGANGVEVRLPALPDVHINWQSASLFIAFALLLTVILLANLTAFQVSSVELKGAARVTGANVIPVVASVSHSIFTLDREKVVDAVANAFPEFSKISLKVGFPNRVILTVSERQPVLAWISGGNTQWIAADGMVMPARGDGGSLAAVTSDVPVPAESLSDSKDNTESASTGTDAAAASTDAAAAAAPVTGPQKTSQQLLQAAISLASQMPSGASLVYDPVAGIGWQDPQGWKVFFGLDLSDLALKENEYQAILARLQSLGVTPSLISVAYVDSPYYRTE
jgi:hypothetical protein